VKSILSILFIALVYAGVAQTSNKKKVLVVPFGRFEFVSEFELEEIALKNETTPSNVFLIYQKAILAAFEDYQDENFEFISVDPVAINPYKKFIKYEYDKFDGKQYYATDLKNFSEIDFTKFLEHHHTDFVVFLTWYDIQKESFTRRRKHEKRTEYAGHYLDYDVYNLFKEKIAGKGKIKAVADSPDDLTKSFKLLRVKEIESGYIHFISKVVEQLNKPIEN
jgi:hypothetical protein